MCPAADLRKMRVKYCKYGTHRENGDGLQRREKKFHCLQYMDINLGYLHYTEFHIIQ